mgnify:CR=1 FL=1
MSRSVLITERAKADLRSYYLFAAEHAPTTAAKWLLRFEATLETLAANAERCTLAPENDLVDETIRQLHFGKGTSKFRALLLIRESEVVVLHIRRGAMDRAEPTDFNY